MLQRLKTNTGPTAVAQSFGDCLMCIDAASRMFGLNRGINRIGSHSGKDNNDAFVEDNKSKIVGIR